MEIWPCCLPQGVQLGLSQISPPTCSGEAEGAQLATGEESEAPRGRCEVQVWVQIPNPAHSPASHPVLSTNEEA